VDFSNKDNIILCIFAEIAQLCVNDRVMNTEFFIEMLDIESTSGRERGFADFLAQRMAGPGRRVETFEVPAMAGDCPDGCGIPVNLMVSWGEPNVVFCTHLDTVPPYIAPSVEVMEDGDMKIKGRGSCDAKGQIFAMWEACLELEHRGCTDFALLLLAGEETGSFGAKAFNGSAVAADDKIVIVGEPTDNHMTSASKGTKSFEVTFTGKAFHSGYPEHGLSAVEMFNDFMNALRSIRFPYDDILGDTTFNVGKLFSDNPQNILSPSLTCRVYFRTTFESDEIVSNVMKNIAGPDARLRFGRPRVQDGSDIVAKDVALWQKNMSVKAYGGDSPTRFETFDGFESKQVSFGSDAPQLSNFHHKVLCGPGSILVAHRPDEHISLSDLEKAVGIYISIFEHIKRDTI
jgi:acetylornithine deacetylase